MRLEIVDSLLRGVTIRPSSHEIRRQLSGRDDPRILTSYSPGTMDATSTLNADGVGTAGRHLDVLVHAFSQNAMTRREILLDRAKPVAA